MIRLRSSGTVVVAVVGALELLLTAAPTSGASADHTAAPAPAAILASPCLDPVAPLSVEESRLRLRLPEPGDPAKLQQATFGRQMIDGGGFQDLGPSFVRRLCGARDLATARRTVRQTGERLWRAAVDRAQRRGEVAGSLPYSDDRPLYWTRLQATAALRQWIQPFTLSDAARTSLITDFDRASRGMDDIRFPAGRHGRLLMSGFDPYTLDGGPQGTAPGAAGNNIRHGNPSGATALSLDGTRYERLDGRDQYVETYTLPVNFPEFARGYLEDTVGPFMRPGPRQLNASITMSQANGAEFDLEQWNGRYHGTFQGNDDTRPCPPLGDVPQLAVSNHGCNTSVVPRWDGPARFRLRNPPQWTATSLPVARMIAARTGASVPRPPGDIWPDTSVAFGVVWHTNYTEFPDCRSTQLVTRNEPVPTTYPPSTAPVPPDRGSCAYAGGGGNYLSNESAYRNTLLRDRLGRHIPAGHIHTPFMQHFAAGDLYAASDATFDAWRRAIVAQGQNLVRVVGDGAP